MAESQQVSDLALPKDNELAGSVFTIKEECIFKSLQIKKKSYDVQPSKDILSLDSTNSKETKLPRVRCQYTLTSVGFLVYFLMGNLRINTSVSMVAMVNQSAIAQWTKNKSDSCLAHLPNTTEIKSTREGCSQPTVSVLVSNWGTKLDRGLLYSIMLTGGPLGIFFGGISSGFLCDSYGRWPSSFYATGALGVTISILILFLVYENADAHPRISNAELDFIRSNQETKLLTRRPNIPWRKILTSVPVHAMIFAVFAQMWAFAQFLIVHVTFLGTILHYPISQNESLSAITFLLMFVAGQVAAWLASLMIKRNIVSTSSTRKLINFIACLGFSVFLFGVYIAGCNRTLSIIFAVLSTSFTGFGLAGCWVVSTEMSPTFAGTLCAMCITTGSLACFILPLVVGYLTEGMQTLEQWNKVFFISIGVVMSSGIVFAVFGSADVQPWNYVIKENGERKNDKQMTF